MPIVILILTPRLASAQAVTWSSRVFAGPVVSSAAVDFSTSTATEGASGARLETDSGVAGRWALELGFADNASVEVGLGTMRIPVRLDATERHLNLRTLTLGVNYRAEADRFVAITGPFIALPSQETLIFPLAAGTREVTVSDKWTWGAHAGILIRPKLDSRWAFGVDLEYMALDSRTTLGVPRALEIRPLVLAFGFSYSH